MSLFSRDLFNLQRNIDSMFGAMHQSLNEPTFGTFGPTDSLMEDFLLTPAFAPALLTSGAGTEPSTAPSSTAMTTTSPSLMALAPLEASRSFNQLAAHMHLDVHSTPTQYLVKCDLPGMDKSNIDVSTDPRNRMLTIKAERKQEYVQKEPPEADQPRSIRQERFYGKVQRSVRLARDADLDRVEAKYENGVLSLNVPRKQLPAEESQFKKVQLQ